MLEYLTGIRETDTSIYKLDNIVQFVCAVVCVFVCVYAEASLRRAVWWLLKQRKLPLHFM